MNWFDLLRSLDNCTFEILKEEERETEYSQCCPLSTGVPLGSDILYSGTVQELCRLSPSEPVSAFLWAQAADSVPAALPYLKNAILFPSAQAHDEALVFILRGFSQERKMTELLADSARRLCAGEGFPSVVERLSSFMKLPVSVQDSAFTILYTSVHQQPDSPSLQTDWELGYVFPKVAKLAFDSLTSYHYSGVLTQQEWEECVCLPAVPGSHRHTTMKIYNKTDTYLNYLTPIFSAGVLIGSFCLYARDSTCLSPTELVFLPRLASLFGLEMQRSDFLQANKASYYSQILSLLFSGVDFSDEPIERRLSYFGYKVKPLRYILVFQFIDETDRVKDLNNVGHSLLGHFQNSIYLVQKEQIIFLHTRDARNPIDKETQAAWDRLAKSIHGLLGISCAFTELRKAELYLEQARAAVRLGLQDNRRMGAYSYNSIRLSHIISEFGAEACKLFCLPSLLRLLEYDEENGTEYSQVLYLCVAFPKSPVKIYETLGIHRNTLYARLEKMHGIIDFDLENGYFCTEALLSYLMLMRQGRIQWDLQFRDRRR